MTNAYFIMLKVESPNLVQVLTLVDQLASVVEDSGLVKPISLNVQPVEGK